MKLITVAGPPSSGKTSIILRIAECLEGKLGVIKFDCLTSFDRERYEDAGIPVSVGYSGKFCPDHFFVSNIEEGLRWGQANALDVLITESAGLCNRCSPHITGILGICVIDCLSGVHTPRKIGPMLKFSDIVIATKGDIVSQAEREVFGFSIKQANSKAQVFFVNGITGQGTSNLARMIAEQPDTPSLTDRTLRFTTPAAACSYCTGEMRIGLQYQMGMMRKMEFNI